MNLTKQIVEFKNIGKILTAHKGNHLFITTQPSFGDESLADAELLRQAVAIAKEKKAVPIHERMFGLSRFAAASNKSRISVFTQAGFDSSVPITYVEGKPAGNQEIAGRLIHCIIPSEKYDSPFVVYYQKKAVGKKWRDENGDYLLLQSLGQEADINSSPVEHTASLFSTLTHILEEQGFTFSNIVRTWFYLKDILSWYGEFNRVRTSFYQKENLIDSHHKQKESALESTILPASTGIGCTDLGGGYLRADILLVRTADDQKPIRILNPAQKEAFRYGASFSRAVRVLGTQTDLLEISGTAAIDEAGISLFENDIKAQANCTLDKLEILMKQANASLNNIVQSTVFVKHPLFIEIAQKVLKERGLELLPAVFVNADVCRAELLFELDAEVLI